jgi:hypothetical protein
MHFCRHTTSQLHHKQSHQQNVSQQHIVVSANKPASRPQQSTISSPSPPHGFEAQLPTLKTTNWNNMDMDSPAQVVQSDVAGKCYFLDKLSPELRNRIYELVLLKYGKTNAQPARLNKTSTVGIAGDKQPALLHTCRQIRSEGIAMYYRFNIFNFVTTTKDTTALLPVTKWMKRIG